MTRSARFREAVAELDAARSGRATTPPEPDLFSVPEPVSVDDAWKDQALAAVVAAARRYPELTAAEVSWPAAVDNRARGWALKESARRGVIRALGWVPSGADRHGRPLRLWASRVYGGPSGAA